MRHALPPRLTSIALVASNGQDPLIKLKQTRYGGRLLGAMSGTFGFRFSFD
jgi:hypothetical protein